ncbi:hypothetical protein VNO78_07306 [Psophocarpus tetragonolobus]|uniref:Uncharacterized protein n=1 Tax=Psophocarpus tetragonolobus TaxID=3891 RepID=A0AAN9XSA1_PSOTE
MECGIKDELSKAIFSLDYPSKDMPCKEENRSSFPSSSSDGFAPSFSKSSSLVRRAWRPLVVEGYPGNNILEAEVDDGKSSFEANSGTISGSSPLSSRLPLKQLALIPWCGVKGRVPFLSCPKTGFILIGERLSRGKVLHIGPAALSRLPLVRLAPFFRLGSVPGLRPLGFYFSRRQSRLLVVLLAHTTVGSSTGVKS